MSKYISKTKTNRSVYIDQKRDLHQQLEIAQRFESFQRTIRNQECVICHRKFFDVKINFCGVCLDCSKCDTQNKPNLFTDENDMNPGDQPKELQNLSYIEEQLIAQIHPIISV